MPPGGYHGLYLRVDLTRAEARLVRLPDGVLRSTLGGSGLGTWLLLNEAPRGVDALAPEAPVIFAFSPLVGTPLTTSAKFALVAKSPLTGRINDALSSSHFALAAKRAGIDALVIVGARTEPCVLIIDGQPLTGDGQPGETSAAVQADSSEGAGDATWADLLDGSDVGQDNATGSSSFAVDSPAGAHDGSVLCSSPGESPEGCPRVTLRPAGELWGLSAERAEQRLQAALRVKHAGSSGFHTAAIGPAGENLVRYASVSNGGRHAGRGGHGAVFGAKHLKAIAIRGDSAVPLHDAKRVWAAAKDLSSRSLGPATEKYRELGTVANLVVFNRLALLPTRNFQTGTFEAADAISGEGLEVVRDRTRTSCAACTIGCTHIYGVRKTDTGSTVAGSNAVPATVRMEYESLFALGSLCGIADPEIVLQAAALCDELGLDTISTGGTIAFAFECAERGLLDPDHAPDPLDPPCPPPEMGTATQASHAWGARFTFGAGQTVLELIRCIARRDGIGHLLAEGSRRSAAAIGGNAATFAPHVKGLEMPGYEPRRLHAMALGLAVGTRGADHNRSSAYEVDFSERGGHQVSEVETARQAVITEDRSALLDSLILCKFLRGVFRDLFEETALLLAAVTGWDVTADELRDTARRIVALRKWFNQREGWTPAEDTLPARFLHESLPGDVTPAATSEKQPPAGAAVGVGDAVLSPGRLRALIEAYNLERGWTPDGYLPDDFQRRAGIDV